MDNDACKEPSQDSPALKDALQAPHKQNLTTLSSKHYQAVAAFIASRVNHHSDIEDLTQTVFLEWCKGGRRHTEPKDARPYLFGIAKHVIQRYYRNENRRPKTISLNSLEDLGGQVPAGSPADMRHPVDREEIQEIINTALDRMPRKAREAFRLRFIEGLTPNEAAMKAGCSIWAFYKRLDKAASVLEALTERQRRTRGPSAE